MDSGHFIWFVKNYSQNIHFGKKNLSGNFPKSFLIVYGKCRACLWRQRHCIGNGCRGNVARKK